MHAANRAEGPSYARNQCKAIFALCFYDTMALHLCRLVRLSVLAHHHIRDSGSPRHFLYHNILPLVYQTEPCSYDGQMPGSSFISI